MWRSSAGALGLMQLMPLTAEEMGVPRRLLKNPEVNIRAGARYLAHLFKRIFKANGVKGKDFKSAPSWMVGQVLAAYNAGPSRVGRWLADDPDEAVPVDVWIEAIPFHETRDYVQAVLTYRVLFIGLHDAKQRSAQLLLPRELKTPYSMAMIDDGTELGARCGAGPPPRGTRPGTGHSTR